MNDNQVAPPEVSDAIAEGERLARIRKQLFDDEREAKRKKHLNPTRVRKLQYVAKLILAGRYGRACREYSKVEGVALMLKDEAGRIEWANRVLKGDIP